MTNETYTIVSKEGFVLYRNRSLVHAAQIILRHHCCEYEVRAESDGWYYLYGADKAPLWCNAIFQRFYCDKKPLRTQAYNETEAFEKFATIIISNYWSDKVNAMTDAEYDKYDKLVLVNGGATS
jgi:hypothetical protein